MMDAERVEQILQSITPERLEALIRDLAASQAEWNRDSVGVLAIVKAVTGGDDLGTGALGWDRYVRIREAIKQTVAQIDGMQYVEPDP